MRLVDAHHHLWDLTSHYYPWLTDQIREVAYGDYSAIRKNYLLSDFRRDIGPLNVVKSVHVQADHDPRDPVAETSWLQGIADNPASGGLPHAIVAFVDLSRPDAPEVLDRHQRFRNLRGIRQMLHFGPALTYLTDPKWLRNLSELADRGLSFDLQIRPSQMNDAAEVIARYPKIQFVLDHAGAAPAPESKNWDRWMANVDVLSKLPNLSVKLSGFGLVQPRWTAASIKPIVGHLVLSFGIDRCMFGSNFPVDSLMKDYQSIWAAYGECVHDLSDVGRDKLFAANAERFYRI